jgi:DNA mismatch repair protein MutS2
MQTDLADLERIEESRPLIESLAPTSAERASAGTVVPVELDLRGLRVDEALEQLERRLSEAILNGLPWIRIIHGHGSGAIKTAVRDALRRMPYVLRSRPGEMGEGGDGATIAWLE